MSKITFEYWTNLSYCMGPDFAGECNVELTDEEQKVFQLYARAINDNAPNVINYIESEMSVTLREKINYAVFNDISRKGAEKAIKFYGCSCFCNMSEEEFNGLSMDELISKCVDENWEKSIEFRIVKISIKDNSCASKHIIKRSTTAKTKYVIDDSKSMSMARFVPALVKIYVSEHKEATYSQLQEIFNDSLIRLSHRHHGVLCTKEIYDKWAMPTKNERYYVQEGPLTSADGLEFYVNTQWASDAFEKVLKLAPKLGFEVDL